MIEGHILGRDYETILMQSCAGCECDLIGISEAYWHRDLPTAVKRQLPPLTFVHIAGRPYCESCRTEGDPAVVIGREYYVPYKAWLTGW